MNEKLNEIVNSYRNGQRKQMVEQIKEYGVNKFHVDFYTFALSPKEYALIVYTFHLIDPTAQPGPGARCAYKLMSKENSP